MINNLVTVIIPTFNRASFLEKCITAVLEQLHKRIEIIIVDDGSTDNTPQVLSTYKHQLKIITQENNGVSCARNVGIREAKGDFIAFCDSDDYWLPKKITLQLEVFKQNKDAMLCHTNEIWIRNGKRVNPKKKHQKFSGDIFEKCLDMCTVSPSSIIMRREFFDVVGNFDEDLPACEDYDLWIRGALRYPFYYLEEPLIIKNGGHEDQLSKKYWGMDRFRIQSLYKCLHNEKLTPEQQKAIALAIIKKCEIFIQGAKKRGNQEEKYTKILGEVSSLI
ncbi:glycosyltransferase family 2 protein [Candidatus Uabimicrobium amorphum]|uniref:Glycosyl transferase n=1 Tax=Uabimicrobium amorphum TaxID=2596890 RepID=A0A5S9IL79_UABAM|nr:glycosyltransferase [Candidatus Uabimicrobium amorphum]BBM83567.1 glycosyl transferase [Candidatus Uabimicrobium amorphum]